MRGISPTDSTTDVKSSKVWGLVVAGYSTAVAGLIAFLTINGASGTPTSAVIGTAGLLTMGLLLPAAGMLLLRRSVNSNRGAAKLGFTTLGFGLIGLYLGVVLVYFESSLSGLLVSAFLLVASSALAMVGAIFLRRLYISTGGSKTKGVGYLILGTALLFSGVGLIVGSKIAFFYLIPQLESIVYMDVGATVSAYGCVLAAYSFFVLHHSR